MATVKNKIQRDFRLASSSSEHANTAPLEFNKIKLGKSILSGDVTAIIDKHDKKNRAARKAIDRKTIEEAIEKQDVIQLRRISNYFYGKSGIYSRLCRYMAYLYKYDWFIIPHRFDDKISSDKVIEGWVKSSILLENSNLKQLFGEISLKVLKNGCYYGYIMQEADAFFLQELPANYCRARYKVAGRYAVEFNVKYFDDLYSDSWYRAQVIKLYPKEIQSAYIAYKKGKLPKISQGDDMGWFLLDPAKSVKFNLSDNDAPLFVSIIPAILDLDDAKKLDKDKMAQQLLKIIIQQMPIDKNGDLIFDVEEAQALHNNVVGMVGEAIGLDVLTTFANVSVADLSDKSNVSSVDQLERVERTVYNEAGVSQMQFNTSGNLALEKSIANDEATMSDLIYQYKSFADYLLKPFNKNAKRLKYSFGMLPTTIYNYKELSKLYKEQTQLGFSKLLPQIALGHSQSDIIATAVFENQMMKLNDLFVPPQMSSTMSGNNKASSSESGKGSSAQTPSDNQGGRPELPDDQKSEKTIQNKEASK